MKYLFLLIISLTPVAALNAEDNEWTYTGNSKDNSSAIYVRTEDMMKGRSNQTSAKAWVKADHSKDATTSFRETKMLLEINCPAQTYKTLSTARYYPNGEAQTDTPSYTSTEHVIPGSMAESVVKLVCEDLPE